MAEPPGSGADAESAATGRMAPAGIRPDVPTANRGRRREPPIIDLEAEASESEPAVGSRAAAASASAQPSAAERDAAKARKAASPEPALELPAKRRRAGGAALTVLVALAIVGFAGGAVYILDAQNSVALLRGRIEQLEAAANVGPTALAGLDRRLAATEGGIAALAGLDRRLAATEGGIAALAGIDKRVGALESGVAVSRNVADEASARSDAARADAAKALALATASRAAPDAPAAVPSPAPVDLSPIDDRLGKLEGRIGMLEARLSQVEAALSAPKTEARATEARAETLPAGELAARLTAAAQALLQALDQGAPYAADLAALEALGLSPARTAVLRPLADKGAPTPHALAVQFAALAEAMPAGSRSAEQPGFWGRLASGAGGLVRVRRVGDVSRPDPASLLAQIPANLDRGNLDAAMDLWSQLPDPAQKATQRWADVARTRAAADKAARGILSDALASLGKS